MGYLVVFVIAAGVGVAVYAITLRNPPAMAAPIGPGSAPSAPGGSGYVPVAGWRPDWQSRLTGLLGLAIAVVVGAAALAFATYVGVSSVLKLFG
jgi:hypothetical protein